MLALGALDRNYRGRSPIAARLITIPAGPLQANCYFIYDAEAGSGFIIDPGGDDPEIMEMIESSGVSLSAILLTHGHADHVAGTAAIAAATGAAVYGSTEVRDVLARPEEYVLFPGMPGFEAAAVDHILSGGEQLAPGGIAVTAIATPGHTPGSMTFLAAGGLFCGDLLFRGSVGRTDFAGGSFDALAGSVRNLILNYPPETVVYPGHGSATTLELEKETNPFLTDLGW